MMDGLVIPIMVLPDSLISFDKKGLILYQVGVYVIVIVLLLLFYKHGKEWRKRFELEMRHRYVQKWEQVLLWIVGCMMMLFSVFMTRDVESISHVFGVGVAKDIASSMIAEGLMSFVLTITTIILIMQGNKRSYYNGIAESRRESGERLTIQMVKALANTIDAKDSYTNGHSTRVAEYSVMIAKRMGYIGEKLEHLYYAAVLHDIGKIGVPREIINKPSRLTDEEYAMIKSHPVTGSNILKEVTEIPDISIGAKYHHERYDGKGYPDGLSGTDIPEIARIIGVADAYDAMTSKRSYRDTLEQEVVRKEIINGKGTQFDPEIAEVMLELIDEDMEYRMHE
ncbi:MAG: HD-GYP domain-containing protein [Lachnospiraceae bacterium]|nr:HD-GYP domain-containing protein [Lachnospiraceae bacterium]